MMGVFSESLTWVECKWFITKKKRENMSAYRLSPEAVVLRQSVVFYQSSHDVEVSSKFPLCF